jgi:hypothetical protein
LNLVVTFMEDPTVPAARGYVYAVLLVSYLAFLPDLDPTLEPD